MAQGKVVGLLRVAVYVVLESLCARGRGWELKRVEFRPESDRSQVLLRMVPASDQAECGECGAACRRIHDRVRRPREWRHTAAWGFPTWVIVDCLRRVVCPRCGIRIEAVPWARKNSRMTRALEMDVLRQARDSSLLAVARSLKLGWKAVFGTVRRAVTEGLKAKRRSWRHLGVDEFNYGRGQAKYITVVWDHDRGEVAWVGTGKAKETLVSFFDWLGRRRVRRIRCITLDMSDAFISAVSEKAPQAKLVFDKFHIVHHLLDAVDELRKTEFWRRGGRLRALVAGKRFLLLKRGSQLTADERERLSMVLDANRDLFAAYLLKEDFERFWDSRTRMDAAEFLVEWSGSVLESAIKPLASFMHMIWKHVRGVMNYFDFPLTNGPVESQNSRTRLISQRARGFRNANNLILMLYHCAGNLNYE